MSTTSHFSIVYVLKTPSHWDLEENRISKQLEYV